MRRIVLIALGALSVAGCVGINQGNRPMGSIIGQTELPQPGEWCRATYPQQRSGLLNVSQSHVTGQVESVDDDGIRLSHVRAGSRNGTRFVGKVPYIGRYFKNTGVGTSLDDVVVKVDKVERLEIISEQDGRQDFPLQVAQQLTAAMPGPHRMTR